MDSVLERIMDKNFNSELEEWFPEVESLTEHQSIFQLLVTIEERVNCRETSVSQITRPWVQVVIVIIFYHPSGNIFSIRTISLGLPSLKQTAPDKHVIAKMPMVTFVITSLTRLTVVVCTEKRFNSSPDNRRIFSSSALRDSFSHLAQIVPSDAENIFKKTLYD